MGIGSSDAIFNTSSGNVSARKGARPVMSSYKIAPIVLALDLYRSARFAREARYGLGVRQAFRQQELETAKL